MQHGDNWLSQRVASLSTELANAANAQAQTRSQLDARLAEIDALKKDLTTSEAQRQALREDRAALLRDVGDLRDDLERVRQDALSLGQDLAEVRSREEQAERQHKQDQARATRLQDELARTKNQLAKVREEAGAHVCSRCVRLFVGRLHPTMLKRGQCSDESAARLARHAQETKGLLAMIRYQKAQFTRETGLRADLAHQKQYLTIVVNELQAR
jgi:DNA repair exonuclease SbcCD ATPase subunit